VFAAKALVPKAQLVLIAPKPLPTVRPWTTAPPVKVDTPVTPRVVLSERLVPVAAPSTGVTIVMLVLVQALMLPLATVPSAGVTIAGLVNSSVFESCLVTPD
jgi:hypothetical protein